MKIHCTQLTKLDSTDCPTVNESSFYPIKYDFAYTYIVYNVQMQFNCKNSIRLLLFPFQMTFWAQWLQNDKAILVGK